MQREKDILYRYKYMYINAHKCNKQVRYFMTLLLVHCDVRRIDRELHYQVVSLPNTTWSQKKRKKQDPGMRQISQDVRNAILRDVQAAGAISQMRTGSLVKKSCLPETDLQLPKRPV